MMSSDQRTQMDFGDAGGVQSSQTSIDSHYNDTPETAEGQSAQHRSLVTFTPRKRLVLDLDKNCEKIVAHIVVRNRSKDLVAFKNQVCDDQAYAINPDRGLLAPGEQVDVALRLSDTCPPDRNIETDQCILSVAPYNRDQHPDLDAYFGSSEFENHERLQRQIMTAAVSQDAKKRLELLALERVTQARQEEGINYYRYIMLFAVCVFLALLGFFVLLSEFCQPLYEPERPRRR